MKRMLTTVAMFAALPCLAQAQSAPPVRMGLWQTTAVTTMSGMQLPPQVVEQMKAMGRPIPGSTPTTSVTQSCLTPDKWQKNWQRAQQGDCHTTNLKQDASGMSADIECKTERGTSTGHTQVDFLSTEKAHATTTVQVNTGRMPQPITMNMTMDSVYQGADCQGVSPDSPKILSH
jgi:hypothetical protein